MTLRFNRAFARARDEGTSARPSLLMAHTSRFSSADATDLGRSTYALSPDTVCALFWKELVNVWAGREDTIRYCIAVNAQAAAPADESAERRLDGDAPVLPPPSLGRGESMPEFTVCGKRGHF